MDNNHSVITVIGSMISIIIPTLNEEENIRKLLEHLSNMTQNMEIIVSDGGSSDKSVEQIESIVKIIHSSRGRAVQMNVGANIACGDILWFLHADCRPHPDSIEAIQEALSDSSIVGGAFTYSLDHPGFRYRLAERLSNWKNRMLKLL